MNLLTVYFLGFSCSVFTLKQNLFRVKRFKVEEEKCQFCLVTVCPSSTPTCCIVGHHYIVL